MASQRRCFLKSRRGGAAGWMAAWPPPCRPDSAGRRRLLAQVPQQPLLGNGFRHPAHRARARRVRASSPDAAAGVPWRRSRSASAIISLKRCTRRRKYPGGGSATSYPAHRAPRSRARIAPVRPARGRRPWLRSTIPRVRRVRRVRWSAGRAGSAVNVSRSTATREPADRVVTSPANAGLVLLALALLAFTPVQQSITLEVRTSTARPTCRTGRASSCIAPASADSRWRRSTPGARPTVTVAPGIYDAQAIREQ